MKPRSFSYSRPDTVARAIATLDAYPGDARVLAGGQSLIPLLNLRLADPQLLVDVSGIAELQGIRAADRTVTIGAATTHQEILTTPPSMLGGLAILPQTAGLIGHLPIRTRGTIGGSIAHADPAAEWCTVALALEARVEVNGPEGTRTIGSDDLFLGPFTSALEEAELLMSVEFPTDAAGYGIREFALRRGDFATVVVAVGLRRHGDGMASVRIAAGGIDTRPVRITPGEEMVVEELGRNTRRSIVGVAAEAGAICASTVRPIADNHASSKYRRHLVRVLVAQALTDALTMAGDEA